jgi:hypothetical protein
MKEIFIEKRFRDDAQNLIDHCGRIAAEYGAEGYDLTVRQLYYQMVAQDLFPDSWVDETFNLKNGLDRYTKNTMKNYKKLAKLVSDARLAGFLDWRVIVDRARSTQANTHWDNHDQILRAAVNSWAIDKWSNQDYYLEVMCEKDAVAGILAPECSRLDIPFTACRGYCSQSLMYQRGKAFTSKWEEGGRLPAVIYFGDHDPSGLDMDRDVKERLDMFSGLDVDFTRAGLTKGQVDELNPPPNPAKATDSRFTSYRRQYGRESWELDALNPRQLIAILNEAVERYRDPDDWKEACQREDRTRRELIERVGL